MSDFFTDKSTQPKIETIPLDHNLMALLNRIIDQNAQIIELNNRILSALEIPRLYNAKIEDFFRK